MGALHLLARIAGERVAISADAIDAVIECGAVTPVPRAASHILGVAALRGRVLTLIDAARAVGAGDGVRVLGEAVLIGVGGHAYALVVDEVEDVVESEPSRPPPPGLAAGWRAVATGVIEVEGALVLAIDPAKLIEGPAPRAA